MKPDIKTREDLKKLVIIFYERLLKLEEFKHIFLKIAEVDVLTHIDLLVDFWESALFQTGKYKGDLIERHLELNQKYHYGLKKHHFDNWLSIFNTAVDELFEGEKASGAKTRALTLATVIKLKIENLERMRLEINN